MNTFTFHIFSFLYIYMESGMNNMCTVMNNCQEANLELDFCDYPVRIF